MEQIINNLNLYSNARLFGLKQRLFSTNLIQIFDISNLFTGNL